MKKSLIQFTVLLCLIVFVPIGQASAAAEQSMVRVGLNFGSTALSAANLENSSGSGYRFGYYDGNRTFVSLGSTQETKITLTIGSGSYGMNVVQTDSKKTLFQFDGATAHVLAVKPGLSDSPKPVTWFKGYRYYGDFMYERNGGAKALTVVNYLSMDDYVKGILPYEMSASWPLEALKAQAVCARSYTVSATGNKHKQYNFDICNSTDCQVYRGINSANANTDRAVTETSGIYAYYKGAVAQTFYYASNGGASEDVRNVWSSSLNLPYLAGKADPYEGKIESKIPGYRWTKTYTYAELTKLLKGKGYPCGNITSLKVSDLTPMGNVLSITFQDENGKTYSFFREKARTTLGLSSVRFQISGSGTTSSGGTGASGNYYVDGSGTTIPSLSGTYAIGDGGKKEKLGSTAYAITASGTEALGKGTTTTTPTPTPSTSGKSVTITGSGSGHNVGMSQWGAYAMAQNGLTYDQILKFYFTGIDLY